MREELPQKKWKMRIFVLKEQDKARGVVIDPSVLLRDLSQCVAFPQRVNSRQTETTVSGLREWVLRLSNLTVLIYFLTSFFCKKITKTLLTITEIRRAHILESSCYGFLTYRAYKTLSVFLPQVHFLYFKPICILESI